MKTYASPFAGFRPPRSGGHRSPAAATNDQPSTLPGTLPALLITNGNERAGNRKPLNTLLERELELPAMSADYTECNACKPRL